MDNITNQPRLMRQFILTPHQKAHLESRNYLFNTILIFFVKMSINNVIYKAKYAKQNKKNVWSCLKKGWQMKFPWTVTMFYYLASYQTNCWTKMIFGNITSSYKSLHKSNKWVWLLFIRTGSGYEFGNCNCMAPILSSYSHKASCVIAHGEILNFMS